MSVVAADAHADLVESLDQRVREAVRREGVDPQRDALVVRRLAEDVVRAHDDRSLTGAVSPVADIDSMVGELVARVSGFGRSSRSWTTPGGGGLDQRPEPGLRGAQGAPELTNLILSAAQVQELVERMLSAAADGSTSAGRSSTRCCRRATGSTWCSRGSAPS